MEELLAKYQALRKEESQIQKTWKEETARVRKEIISIKKSLAKECRHEVFIRDNYIYAELYCKDCLLPKKDIYRLRPHP